MAFEILVSDPLAEEGVAHLRSFDDVVVHVETEWSHEELVAQIHRFDGLVVRSGTQVTADVIEAADRLKVIARAGVGVDNIDVEAATKKGILVINSPDGNTLAAAEHTLAMLLALARQIPQAHHALVHEGRWARKEFVGVQLDGKVLGIIGLGRIGVEVARRARAFGMELLGYDPYIPTERARKLGVELTDVDDICRRADFITLHTPLTKQTQNLINRERIALMKRDVRIINCARGGIIDEEALADALDEGRVAGAALDVFSQEPPTGSRLLKSPKVVATPHLGASTYEAQVRVALDVADAMVEALRGGAPRNAVNAPMFQGDRFEELRPYLDLCERLGRIFTGLFRGGHDRIEVVYSGDAAELESMALTTAVLKGMLAPVLHERVNYVNARIFAEERGIQLVETREPTVKDFSNLVTLRGRSERGTVSVSGTVMQGGLPTLVDIDGYRVNVFEPGRLFIAKNVDRPGIIGQVGTLLGEAMVNIAFMQVGRKAVGSDAVMVLGIDQRIPDDVMEKLNQLEALSDIRLVEW